MNGFSHVLKAPPDVPIIEAQSRVPIDKELYIRSSHGTLGRCHELTSVRALVEVRTVGLHIYNRT